MTDRYKLNTSNSAPTECVALQRIAAVTTASQSVQSQAPCLSFCRHVNHSYFAAVTVAASRKTRHMTSLNSSDYFLEMPVVSYEKAVQEMPQILCKPKAFKTTHRFTTVWSLR